MATHKASAYWEGDLKGGKGKMKVGSGAFDVPYSFISRFEEQQGTNPEELIGAAHAGCYSMALSHGLATGGFPAKKISTTAKVSLEKVADGFAITTIELTMEGEVPKIDEATFLKFAEDAKKGCPVSKALAGVNIKLNAKLLAGAGK